MLWVYDHYKYVYSFSTGIDFRRQNLTLAFTADPSAERVNPCATGTVYLYNIRFQTGLRSIELSINLIKQFSVEA